MKNIIKKIGIIAFVAVMGLGLFTSCEEPGLELDGTKWVYGYTKAELVAEMEQSEALLDQSLALLGITINFPVPVYQIAFISEKSWTYSQNNNISSLNTINTPSWEVVSGGTYTIDGDDVTLNIGNIIYPATVDGNTLTLTYNNDTVRKFKKQ